MKNIFYVYAYLDPRKPGNYSYGDLDFNYEPFYIGKGKGDRMKHHLRENKKYNPHKNRVISNIIRNGMDPIILILDDNLSENDALSIEISTISKIGRKNLKKGPLTNLTNGGEGSSGHIQSEITKSKRSNSLKNNQKCIETMTSKEFSEKISILQIERYKNLEERKRQSEKMKGEKNHRFGKKNSEIQKQSVRKAHMDGKIKLSEDGRKKVIEAGKNRKGHKLDRKRCDVVKYILISPLLEEFTIYGSADLQNFCKNQKIQYHTLKNNHNTLITENLIIGARITAKNTIGWKLIRS